MALILWILLTVANVKANGKMIKSENVEANGNRYDV